MIENKKIDEASVFNKDEQQAESKDFALTLLTTKGDDRNTLDLLTNIKDMETLYNIVDMRMFNDIFFKGEDIDKVLDNYDENIRSLFVSLDRGGREDIKEVKGFEVLGNMMEKEAGGGGIGLRSRILSKLGVNRDG